MPNGVARDGKLPIRTEVFLANSHPKVRMTLAVEKDPTIVVTDPKDGYAWFHAVVRGTASSAATTAPDDTLLMRISGIAARTSGGAGTMAHGRSPGVRIAATCAGAR